MPSQLGPWEIGLIVLVLVILALFVYIIYLIVRALKKYINRDKKWKTKEPR